MGTYAAVGMQRALHSAIGLLRRPTRASWMLGFLMPADVRRNFIDAPMLALWASCSLRPAPGRISMETDGATKTHRPRPDPFSLLQACCRTLARPASVYRSGDIPRTLAQTIAHVASRLRWCQSRPLRDIVKA